jgi:hypothetical protein
LLSIISGRLPTTSHGNGPGGSGTIADEHVTPQMLLLNPNLWTRYMRVITTSKRDAEEQVPNMVVTATRSDVASTSLVCRTNTCRSSKLARSISQNKLAR